MWYDLAMATDQLALTGSASSRDALSAREADKSWHLLSVTEIATVCRLSEKAVRRAIDDGELPAIKLRSRLRVTPQDFEEWISASRRRGSRPMTPQRQRTPRRAPAGTFRTLVESEAEL
jgi:excisionase family DNA binding protein